MSDAADPTAETAPETDVHTGSGLTAEKPRRLGRVDEIRGRGDEPYPYRFDRSHTLAEVRAEWGAIEAGTETESVVTVAGRVMLKRDTGKLVFATIRDRDGEVQLFVSKAVVGAVGPRITSTLVKACANSRAIRRRSFCACR